MKQKSRMRQWARAAWALALLFATLPLASRLLLGAWGFQDAAELAFLCLAAGGYFEIAGRRKLRALRDDAAALQRALTLASEGHAEPAIAILTRAIRLSPRLWQAYQYRGQLRLLEAGTCDAALADFNEAIRLAPKEPHLYTLRSQAYRLLGDEMSAHRDSETALALSRPVH
jgi:tetratricopeptide (TPR) repeat protein